MTDPNQRCRYTTKSFAPLMAKAAKLAIVEAENIVEVGEIDPNDVDLPGIFIDRIVPATEPSQVEILKTRSAGDGNEVKPKGDAQLRRDRIARRAAKELKDGFYVNLGVGKELTSPGNIYMPDTQTEIDRPRHPHHGALVPPRRSKGLDSIRERHPRYGRLSPARRGRHVCSSTAPCPSPCYFLVRHRFTNLLSATSSTQAKKPRRSSPVQPPSTRPSPSA